MFFGSSALKHLWSAEDEAAISVLLVNQTPLCRLAIGVVAADCIAVSQNYGTSSLREALSLSVTVQY